MSAIVGESVSPEAVIGRIPMKLRISEQQANPREKLLLLVRSLKSTLCVRDQYQ